VSAEPRLTAGEKAKVAWYVGRMCKRQLAGDNVHQADLQRKVERVIDGARKRDEKSK
jgi:hypothetical protein